MLRMLSMILFAAFVRALAIVPCPSTQFGMFFYFGAVGWKLNQESPSIWALKTLSA